MPKVIRPRHESPTPAMRLVLPLLLATFLTWPFAGLDDARPWLAMLGVGLPLAAWQAMRSRPWTATLLVSVLIAFVAAVAGATVAFLTADWI